MCAAMKAEPLFFEGGDVLGEGPYWSTSQSRLYWVDLVEHELHSMNLEGREHSCVRTSEKVHAIAEAKFPWFVCTVHRHGLAWLNVLDGTFVPIVDPEPGMKDHLLNDARCDPMGRFWFGSLHKRHEPTGSLYCLDGNGQVHHQHRGFGASNGIAFSPDHRNLYFSDTYNGLFKFDFDLEAGRATNPRKILDSKAGLGLPDGLTIDDTGCLWVAMALKGQVLRLTPDGVVDAALEVPSTFVTSCTFAGPQLDTLLITTGRAGRPADELAAQPSAGAVFVARVGNRGFAEAPYAGQSPASSH